MQIASLVEPPSPEPPTPYCIVCDSPTSPTNPCKHGCPFCGYPATGRGYHLPVCGVDTTELPPPHTNRFKSPEQESVLELIVRIPTYGKPERSMQVAERVLRSLRLSFDSQCEVQIVTPTGERVAAEYIDTSY